jgi:HD-GYP domain-containing protein (c-di-GMP phosphodiesterase class II)
VQDSREKGTIGFKQAKRAIQSIVDLMMNDEASLLGLTTLRCHDQYTHNHSVNVSLLSMALGNRAGYPKVELADLGLAALFHDLGKATIPMEVLNKPGEFTDEEWAMMRNHPTEGAPDGIGIIRTPYEHGLFWLSQTEPLLENFHDRPHPHDRRLL